MASDLFSRQMVGWPLRPEMTREILIDALRIACLKHLQSGETALIFHSDRGSQHASQGF